VLTFGGTADTVKMAVPIFLVALFAACMVCHGELARRKPHPGFLTGFYLMVALGGAMGGLFVALVAPRIFNGNDELPYAIVATTLVVVALLVGDFWLRMRRHAVRVGWLALTMIPIGFSVVDEATAPADNVEIERRNFYGTLRVSDAGTDDDRHRKLVHGAITHGHQFLDPERRKWPTTYYAEESGVGLAIVKSRTSAGQRVGLIGLGAGTLAAYSRPGDRYRFYEINPLVVEMARSRFSYLQDADGTIDVVLGDARLSLEREPAQHFDVLVVDAFAGDAIPVHLLTREAFAQYFRHLAPGGVLAIHVSNHHLDLAPIVRLAADHYGKQSLKIASPDDDDRGASSSDWVLVADDAYFESRGLREAGDEIDVDRDVRPWTDDYSSLLPILRVLTGRKAR
jgi:SAM-dependent methyltransferase